jgi:hypothetical protein
LGRQGIRFQDDAFWPIYSPSSIYQNFPGSGNTFTQPVNFHPFLFGRFPVEKYVPISERSYPFCDRVAPQTGIPNFMEEVGASTQPRLRFTRGTLSDRPETSFLPRGKISSVPARQFLQLIGFLISLMDVIPLGRLHIRPIQWYLREFWHPVTQMWQACIHVLPRLLPHLQWWLQRSNLLTCVPLDYLYSTLTLYTDASLTGWGCLPRRENSVRGVGRLSFRRTHKSSGNEGRSIVIETLPRSDSKTVSVDSHIQYDSGGLSPESRGNSLFFSVSSMQRNSVAMRQFPDSVKKKVFFGRSIQNYVYFISQ